MTQQGPFKVVNHVSPVHGSLEDRLNELRERYHIMSVVTLRYETRSNGQNHGHGYTEMAQYQIICHEHAPAA